MQITWQRNRIWKRIGRTLTAVCIGLTVLGGENAALLARAESGSCGNQTTWSVSNGTLTISGSGAVGNLGWSGFDQSITSVVVQDGVTSLPNGAFQGYPKLQSLMMADSVTTVGNYLCHKCTALQTVELSNQIQRIECDSFYGCTALRKIDLPDALTFIGDYAFFSCLGLTDITLPDGVTEVGDNAFWGTNAKTLTLGTKLQSVGETAFAYACYPSVTLPPSLTEIGKGAFGPYCLRVEMKNGSLFVTYPSQNTPLLIYGAAGSAAQEYAEKNAYTFQVAGSSAHTCTGDWEVEQAATCTTDGVRICTCTICGQTMRETIPATGHAWSDWTVNLAASCTTDGTQTRTCSNCHETETQSLSATGHAWSDWVVTLAPTCTENGVETKTCAHCGERQTQSLSATGHAWSDWVVTLAPTCTENGRKTMTCANCGATQSLTLPATGHDWSQWTVVTPATCTEEGLQARTCQNCGEEQTKAIHAKGHAWSAWEIVTPAGEYTEGLQVRTCANCGETQQETLPPINGGFLISLSAGAGGTLSPAASTVVAKGGSLSVTITPDSGYLVLDVVVDGESVGATNQYTFTDVSGGHQLSVSFVPRVTEMNVVCSDISVACQLPYYAADAKTFSMDAFAIIATIVTDGVTEQIDITEDCTCDWTPVACVQNGMYEEISVPFSYHGTQKAIQTYVNAQPITGAVTLALRGDGNLDGRIAADDANFALQVYVVQLIGKTISLTTAQSAIMDVQSDQKIDSDDATLILRYYVTGLSGLTQSWDELLGG